MDPKTEASQRVVAYLAQNKARLSLMTLDFIVRDVRLFGPDTSALTDYEVRSTAAVWRSLNGPLVPLPSPVARTPSENKMIAAVKKAVNTAIDGVDLSYGPGTINISITGPTAELKKGDLRLAAGVTWTGTLGVEAQAGNFHLAGELSSDRWSVSLS